MKLNTWLDIWLNKYNKHTVKLRTYERYHYIINKHICPLIGDYELDDLSCEVLQDYILEKIEKGNLKTGKGLANNSTVGIANVLKQALKQAKILGYVKENNSTLVKLPTITEKEITVFNEDEQNKLVDFCLNSKKSNYIGIVICLYSGIRLGELLALTWNDIDFEKGFMHITKTTYKTKQDGKNVQIIDNPKTKSSNRVIPLPKSLLEILKKYKKNSISQYVISTRSNTIVGTRSYQKTYERILKKLNIPYKNFHSLRHTFATRASEMGMDARTLSEILGHKNPMITLQRYTHSLMSYKMDFMNKLGKSLA